MKIRCKAFFEANNHDQIGFYGPPGEPQRRIRNGDEFMYEYDWDSPPEIVEREVLVFDVNHKGEEVNHRKEVKKFIGNWIEVLEMPRKKPGPKKVSDGDQHVFNA